MPDPLPTLYKARNLPLKRPVCAICVERTRGRTMEVRLGYRVTVWLCPGHASTAFQTRRGGRDFVRTLWGVWQANGCLTQARHRALDAHLASLRAATPRTKPGSYSWPDLRRQLEARYATGTPPLHPAHLHTHPACTHCTARTPQPPHPPALARPTPLAQPPTVAAVRARLPRTHDREQPQACRHALQLSVLHRSRTRALSLQRDP